MAARDLGVPQKGNDSLILSRPRPQEIRVRNALPHVMVETATVTSKGQVTLPASLRKRLGIREGTRLLFMDDDVGVRLLTEDDLNRMFEVFDRRRKQLRLTRKRLETIVEEAKERVWRRHYAGRR